MPVDIRFTSLPNIVSPQGGTKSGLIQATSYPESVGIDPKSRYIYSVKPLLHEHRRHILGSVFARSDYDAEGSFSLHPPLPGTKGESQKRLHIWQRKLLALQSY